MAPSLIGPPTLQTTTRKESTGDPLMDQMITNFNTPNRTTTRPPARMGRTENSSATFLSTGNPCLNLFFHVLPSTPSHSLKHRLADAWAHDPLTTLKLICNLRGVRGTGKSDKNGFYTAAFWLHSLHPKTLACNLNSFAEFGCFKDFPEILFRILGLTRTPKMEKTSTLRSCFGGPRGGGIRYAGLRRRRGHYVGGGGDRGQGPFSMKRQRKDNSNSNFTSNVRVRQDAIRHEREKEVASEARHKKRAEMANMALERYNRDPDYKFLHDRVSDLFAERLKSDMEELKYGNCNKISLAAKWCPSLDSSYDRATLLCEAIARKIYPKDIYSEYSEIDEAHYAYRVRDRLRKEVLVPLRKALELPELFMSARKWDELKYNRVASVAMKTYKDIFVKHDEERFKEYLEKVKSGKAKIAAGALLPHEIIASLFESEMDRGDVPELQWKRMVDDLSKIGKLSNCIAVCDVSGSMSGTPMEVCVALGLLLSELSEEPWKGKVITFSKNPKLHLVKGDDLMSKTDFIRRMDWGANTNFQKVFDLILQVAVQGKITKEQMIKRVFVFSDMEFDQASRHPWETDYKVIRRKFEKKGYGDSVPEIVFWNLRDSRSTPVEAEQKGVALVSGFSKNMMKLFLQGKDQLDPESVMEAAIAGEEYSKLAVLD